MRLFTVRKAHIDNELRKTFERYGKNTMQFALASTNYFFHNGAEQQVIKFREPLLEWLTEQYDKKERHDNWSLLMEIAITFFVAMELLLEVAKWLGFIK